MASLPTGIREHAARIAFDGTSATALLVDRASGHVIADAKLYNEAQVCVMALASFVCAMHGFLSALLCCELLQMDWLQ